jgi:lysozyme family protein
MLLLTKLKTEYTELKQLIAKYVQIVEKELSGRPGAEKKERVISLVDEAIKLQPLWDAVLNLDGMVIRYLVDKVVDFLNTVTGGNFAAPELETDEPEEAVDSKLVALTLDTPVDLQVKMASSTKSVNERLADLYNQYGIERVTMNNKVVSSTPAAHVPPISSVTQHNETDETAWKKCLNLVFGHEGGVSNNANDRGGLTNLGITHGTLATAVAQGIVDETDVRKLTRHDAATIYRKMYWEANNCHKIQWYACYLAFDACVNGGKGMWARCAQESLNEVYAQGLATDGKYGPKTDSALQRLFAYGKNIDVQQLNRWGTAYLKARKNYYDRIVARDSSQKVFLNGWYNRIRNIAKQIGCNLPAGL